MPYASRLAFSLAAAFAVSHPALTEPSATRPQYVVISFDGAHDVAQWERSRRIAADTGAHFTYFLSCVFLLSPETRLHYQAPGMKPGRSNVGFGASKADVAARLGQIWTARGEGHEIASHGCGHFDGRAWTKADWLAEFGQFSTILRDAYAINGIEGEPEGWRDFAAAEIAGFRAPYLSTGSALVEAETASGMRYDASGVSRGPVLPPRREGVRQYALPLIPEGPAARKVIAMDYNLFVRHSGGFERDDAGGEFEERAYRAFMAAFERQHDGARIPLQVGFHFTLMNGGAYWRALERFARDVCVREDVRCVTYSALTKALDEAPSGHAGG